MIMKDKIYIAISMLLFVAVISLVLLPVANESSITASQSGVVQVQESLENDSVVFYTRDDIVELKDRWLENKPENYAFRLRKAGWLDRYIDTVVCVNGEYSFTEISSEQNNGFEKNNMTIEAMFDLILDEKNNNDTVVIASSNYNVDHNEIIETLHVFVDFNQIYFYPEFVRIDWGESFFYQISNFSNLDEVVSIKKDKLKFSVSLGPNPIDEQLIITISDSQDYIGKSLQLSVYDSFGRGVKKTEITIDENSQIEVSVKDLNSGICFVGLEVEGFEKKRLVFTKTK